MVYTRAQRDAQLAEYLLARQTPFFSPYQASITLADRRPLLQGYLFLLASRQERLEVLTTRHVSRLLPVPQELELFQDLQNLWRVISCGGVEFIESPLVAGRAARIKGGPLDDLRGILIEEGEQPQLLVPIRFLRRGAAVVIDEDQHEIG